jgi:hypothetical protein
MPDARRNFPGQRWLGLALGSAGAIMLYAVVRASPADDTLRFWMLSQGIRPQHLLPLAGIGAALGLATPRLRLVGAFASLVGAALAFLLYRPLLEPLWAIPNIATHQFLVAPASAIAAGMALLCTRRCATLVLPVSSFAIGMATALHGVVSDPSLGTIVVRVAGGGVALWMVGSIMLIASSLKTAGWSGPAASIFGSWLCAIGLIYGSFVLIPKHSAYPNPDALSSGAGPVPDIGLVPEPNDSSEQLPP